jgi:hypothetical protein
MAHQSASPVSAFLAPSYLTSLLNPSSQGNLAYWTPVCVVDTILFALTTYRVSQEKSLSVPRELNGIILALLIRLSICGAQAVAPALS